MGNYLENKPITPSPLGFESQRLAPAGRQREGQGRNFVNPVREGQGFDPALNKELMLSVSTIPSINSWGLLTG